MPPDDLPIIKLRLPTPYPVGRINAYFIDGAEPALIDAGVYSERSLAALHEQLNKHGKRVEDIRRIFITHGHYDHAGAALHLSSLCKATLHIHEKSELLFRWPPDMMERLFNFLLHCGVPRALLEAAFKRFNSGGRFADLDAKPHELALLKGGEEISVGERALRVVATPGHSPDHLCYLFEDSGALFCGDMLLPHITPNPLLYLDARNGYRRTRSLLDYIDSLNSLESRFTAVGRPGHGSDIESVPALIAKNKDFIAEREKLFVEKIGSGSATPYDLAIAAFGDLDAANQYLAVSETVAYLDLLERDGKASVDWNAETITVTAV